MFIWLILQNKLYICVVFYTIIINYYSWLQKNDLQVKLENIFRLVLPNSYIRNEILRLQPIIVGKINQHQCIYDLLSLFNKKCTRQDNVSI